MDIELKKAKMLYIMEHAAQNGYDTTAFHKFYADKYKQSLEIDAKTLEQIVELVEEYKVEAEFEDLTEASRETAAPPEPVVR